MFRREEKEVLLKSLYSSTHFTLRVWFVIHSSLNILCVFVCLSTMGWPLICRPIQEEEEEDVEETDREWKRERKNFLFMWYIRVSFFLFIPCSHSLYLILASRDQTKGDQRSLLSFLVLLGREREKKDIAANDEGKREEIFALLVYAHDSSWLWVNHRIYLWRRTIALIWSYKPNLHWLPLIF